MHKFSILTLSATIGFAGLNIFFSNSIPYATTLLAISILLVIGATVWFIYEAIPRAITDTERPKKIAKMIYQKASQCGGSIHATHIFPTNRNPKDDFAVAMLKEFNPNAELKFNRIILLDSKEDESAWIENLFNSLPENIDKKFYVMRKYPLVIPLIFKDIIPRLNFLLYCSPSGHEHISFIGLDKLHSEDISVNFAVFTRRKLIYKTLLKYFEKVSGKEQYFLSCTSIKDYRTNQPIISTFERGQGVIARAIEFVEDTPGLVYTGLFGSIAQAALGLSNDFHLEQADADVDLIIIYEPRAIKKSVDDLKREIELVLNPECSNVTWGPCEQNFYEFRDPKKINIDIEFIEIGSEFYQNNKLLGYSIFRHFWPTYSFEQKPISEYLNIPVDPLTEVQRCTIVVNDRQGFQYFQKKLGESLICSDPRRICAHVMRNMVWALTGAWPVNSRTAAEYLIKSEKLKMHKQLLAAKDLLNLSTEDIKKNLDKRYNDVLALVNCSIDQVTLDNIEDTS